MLLNVLTSRNTAVTLALTAALVGLLLSLLLSGCSLVDIDLPSDPLTPTQINTRLATHEFCARFTGVVMAAGDSIIQAATDPAVQITALRWKVHAVSACRQAVLQTSPSGALVDTWVFCAQMFDFLDEGQGKDLFGPWQGIAIAAADTLLSDIARIARQVTPADRFSDYESFVVAYVAENPLDPLYQQRSSSFPSYLRFFDIPDSLAIETVGTLPQVTQDFASSMAIYGEQLPLLTRWRAEMLLRESGIDTLDVEAQLDSMQALVTRIVTVAETSPELLRDATRAFHEEMQPLLLVIDQRLAAMMVSLSLERAAIIEALAIERAAVMADLDHTAQAVVAQTMDSLHRVIKLVLILAIILALVIIGGPFVLGFLAGRAVGRRRRRDQ